MTNRELEQKLKEEIQAQTPDVLEAVLKKSQKGSNMELFEQPRKKTHTGFIAAAAAFLLICCGLLYGYTFHLAVDSIIELDVNPSIELRTNRREKVLDVRALNDDAATILDGMELKGVNLDVALNALMGSMLKNGFISESKNSILISVENANTEKGAKLQQELTDKVNALFAQNYMEGAVLSQTIDEDQKLKEIADQYGISLGKARLILRMAQDNPALKMEDLAKLSINDLTLLSAGRTQDNGLTVNGQPSAGDYIGQERAWEIAMDRAGGGTITELEMDYENGRMVYEGELRTDTLEVDFDIDATTGTVVKWEEKQLDRPNMNQSEAGISRERAQEIARNRAGGGTVTELLLDRDDGRLQYEGQLLTDTLKIEFDIDATNGEIIKWEEEKRKGTDTSGSLVEKEGVMGAPRGTGLERPEPKRLRSAAPPPEHR